ncbi:capsid protein [Circoviridae sp.]|nr:capsid protein [Circoviridae sp.]UOF78987.1 capsid protein [Cressdnaviricota sp.]
MYNRKYKRRNYRRKTPWYNKRYSTLQLARKAVKGVRYLKGLVNSEMLHQDFSYSAGTNITNTGFITNITALSQGDSSSTRTGNSILLRSIYYRFKIEINPSVTSNTTITMLLLKDKQQTSDTSPLPGDILSSLRTEAMINLDYAGRFKILKRKTFYLTPSSGGQPVKEIVGYRKVYDHVRYNGTASTDIQKNGYYLLFISSENTNYPTIQGTTRIGYHDN